MEEVRAFAGFPDTQAARHVTRLLGFQSPARQGKSAGHGSSSLDPSPLLPGMCERVSGKEALSMLAWRSCRALST